MIWNMNNEFKHLSINERYKIKEMKDKGIGISEIAENLKRSKSGISMEIIYRVRRIQFIKKGFINRMG